ncbi:MAG TPA: hypothetical protein VGE07_25155 [Herpetosiphonaceae bacterium]
MTTPQIAVAALQSIMQLWAAAAYGAAFLRTRRSRYLGLAVGQVFLLGSIIALMVLLDSAAIGAVFMAVSLWSLFAILTNRSDPIHYPGYASSRDVFTFRPPLPGSERRDG